ncbi:Retron-type RNA-directed DNA polymerase [hydrothermal vent metagenome]|uniref:Retron-type RNA-directed DNA polymerase n=1 Tax=hydrothermal vent metagenome TaxID=652676 RepID=A0A3B0YNF0_9ZZZZ
MSTQNEIILWRNVRNAGGVDSYVNQQLDKLGFIIKPRDASELSKAELKLYKKALQDEAIEKKKLLKDVWAAYKREHIVHLGEGLYWNDNDVSDQWDLDNAESRAANNELPELDSPQQLAELLGITISELRWFCYHRDAATSIHYRRFTIPKSDGSQRAIWAPMEKLKAVQRTVLSEIVERLLVHGSTHGFYAGRSIYTNAQQHSNPEILVKMDLKDFFPSVTFPRVKGIFRKAGYQTQISTLLAALCTESPREEVTFNDKTYFVALGPRCLPQGAPTSPGLTNALCLTLDRRMQALCTKNNWRYSRYADDMTFSVPIGAKSELTVSSLIGTVYSIVKDEGFRVNAKKTKIKRTGVRQKVTGLVVNGDKPPRPPRKLKRQIRAAIHNLKSGKALPEGESIARLKGYASYIKMCEPELGQKMMDALNALNHE